ncbi:MAG: SDR family NAD(P)-dependent oxidoreductase [Ruminococcaceae bacterium]|nr:SDR family NAD(P)-dependent oxidoreductase [Oscillospiraceae bacterium]
MKTTTWLKKNTCSLEQRTVAISGSTGGIGRELCSYIAALGASLVLIDRNRKKSEALKDELVCRYPDLSVTLLTADMSDPHSVDEAIEELKELPIDVLICNAGAYSIPRYKCENGYDNVFQINFVSPYTIVRRLLPNLRERNGKVVVVGSIAHNYSKSDPNDVDFSTRKKSSLVYGNSKRYLMFTLSELFKNELEVGFAITHPGITFTGITSHYPKLLFAIIKHPMKIVFPHPRRACLSVLLGVFENTQGSEWIGPRFFNIWGIPKKKKLRTVKSEELEYFAKWNEDKTNA